VRPVAPAVTVTGRGGLPRPSAAAIAAADRPLRARPAPRTPSAWRTGPRLGAAAAPRAAPRGTASRHPPGPYPRGAPDGRPGPRRRPAERPGHATPRRATCAAGRSCSVTLV